MGDGVRVGSSLVRLDIAATNATQTPPKIGDEVPTIVGPSRRVSPHEGLRLDPGFRLGHFEVIDALGSGGMATVLRARDTELGRTVALKILPPESAHDPDSVTRFKQEARAAAKLDHDNVARVFFYGEDKGLHFIAFEYVDGETLKTLIDRRGTLDPADCVRYLLQLAAGLQHASDRGVIHRDMKPSNIVITPDGKAKIIDMGLARQQGLHSVNGGVTQSGMTLGTFDYISPEQALDPRSVDVRSDIYSLGCAFYHALTGRAPVPEGTAAKKLHAHQHEPPIDPRQINPLVPDGLAVVLSGMMVKDRNRRYAGPEALIRDLLAVAESMGIALDATAFPTLSNRSSTSQVLALTGKNRPQFHGAVLLGLVAIAVSVVVLAVILGGRGGNKTIASTWDDPPPTRLGGGIEFPQPGPAPVASAKKVLRPATAGELLAALGESNVTIQLEPGKVYDLSTTAGATFGGKELILESQNPAIPATVKLAAIPVDRERPALVRDGTLTISGAESARMQGVRFLIAQKPESTDESLTSPVGIAIEGVNKLEFLQCQFELDFSVTATEGIGVQVLRSGKSGATDLVVRNATVGLRRWVGFDLTGAVKADFAECGFATSRAGVCLSGDGATPSLVLKFCTFLIENRGSAIEVRDSANATIQAGFSLFASNNTDPPAMMMMTEPNERRPAMIRTAAGSTATAMALAGQPSAFFRVDIPTGWEAPLDLKQHPWASATPAAKLDSAEPWKAFELNPRIKQLRVLSPREVQILGVKQLPLDGTKIYGTWPPGGTQADTLPTGVKVWYPNPPAAEKESLPTNVYENLPKLIAELKPNDTIWIRGTGSIEVPLLPPLAKPDFRVTIRPEDDKGTVTLVPAETNRLESAMFRLEEGELRFERIEFRLKPTIAKLGDLKSQAVVAVAGGRNCEFVGCTITMEQQKDEVLSAVSLLDGSAIMRKTEPARRPAIRMENCILRGRGRAIWAANAFPFDFAASNVFAALAAPLVDLEAPTKAPASGPIVTLTLSHVTAWLGGGLLESRCGKSSDEKPGPFVPVEIRTESCLFVPIGPTPLAVVAGGDAAQWERYIAWVNTSASGYGNYPEGSILLELTTEDSDRKGKRLDMDDWVPFAKEKPANFGKVTFARSPDGPKAFAQVRSEDAAVETSTLAPVLGCRIKDLPKTR